MGANFYVTLTATVQVSDDALLHDKLQGTVDYGQIVEVLKQEMKQPSSLLELSLIHISEPTRPY